MNSPRKRGGYFVEDPGQGWKKDWKPGTPAEYIQPGIPHCDMPAYRGERYEATVPDTLDLAERVRLAIHGMTENTHPGCDHDLYCGVEWLPSPRMLSSGYSSADVTVKLKEAVCLARIMCGSEQNLHVDRVWMDVCLKQQGDDGLIYIPVKGRPWVLEGHPEYISGGIPDIDQWISPFMNGQMLRNMSVYAARDGSVFWPDRIRRIVDGLTALAVDGGEFAYFWPGAHSAQKTYPPNVRPRLHFSQVEVSMVTLGLTLAYRQTGYEPALNLARKLHAFQRHCFFTPEGAMLTPQQGSVKAHLLAHVRGMISMADYGLIAQDDELLQFAASTYEWARTGANQETGYFPNLLPCPGWRMPERISGVMGNWPEGIQGGHWTLSSAEDFNPCEVAGLAGMVGVALKLSDPEDGIADYWDDVDRWVRNMIAESQMLDTDWVYYLPGTKGGESLRVDEPVQVGPNWTTERVPERNLGSWPTAALPNDWCGEEGKGGYSFSPCDTAWVTRTLYWVWKQMLTYRHRTLSVHLLFNRASPWADIDSYVPYQGRVDIRVKQPLDLCVRIPEWVSPPDVGVRIVGGDLRARDRTTAFDGRYVRIGSVRQDDVVTVAFPIPERTDSVDIRMGGSHGQYSLVRRGNDVVSIFPRGRYYPFYQQRGHYRTGEPRWRKVERFVSDESVDQ